MKAREFGFEFEKLLSMYPRFRPSQPKKMAAIWFEAVRLFDIGVMREARKSLTQEGVPYFPSLPEFEMRCREANRTLGERRDPYRRRDGIEPEPHMGCIAPQSSQIRVEGPRRLLQSVNVYEAIHVLCPGKVHPVCPACGATQDPFVNGFIQQLMQFYPDQTHDWNPHHKGFLLCEECARRLDRLSNFKYVMKSVGSQH